METKKRIWTVSSKGGVGTSTVCVNLARAFAAAGQRVLLIDLDTSCPGLDMLLGVEHDAVYDTRDVLLGRASVADAAIKLPHSDNMFLLCGAFDPTGDLPLTALDAALKQAETELGISVTLFDSHGLGIYANTMASIATHTLLVVEPTSLSLRGAESCGIFLESIHAPRLKMVVNRYDFDLLDPPYTLAEMIDLAGVSLLGVIPLDMGMADAQSRGMMAKEGAAYNTICAFRNIAHRIFMRHSPLFSGYKKFNRKKYIN